MSEKEGLSKSSVFGYGLAEWGSNAVETFFRINLLIYCTDILNISPGTAGLVVALGVIWDGITDPLVGNLSIDQSKWEAGPLYSIGCLSSPLALILLFSIAPGSDHIVVKFALAYLLGNTALTLISVPHAALAGDMSHSLTFAIKYSLCGTSTQSLVSSRVSPCLAIFCRNMAILR